MNNNIENFIEKNKEYFNLEEPPTGHFERFKQKLEKKHKISKFTFYKLYGIAATFLLLIVGSYFILQHSTSNKMMRLSEVSEEYEEIEYYYNHIIKGKMQELKINSPSLHASFIKDQEVMEKAYKTLQKELYRNPNNDFIIESMMANYKTRVEVLDRINRKLETINIAQK